MWQIGRTDPRQTPSQSGLTGAQSSYDLLLGMRGAAITLLYLDLTEPDHPVALIPGFVESVSSSSLVAGLTGPLPHLEPNTRFGVELMAGPSILRFQSQAHRPPVQGSVSLELTLPRQIESVQRRKFTRVVMSVPVAFSSDPSQSAPGSIRSGIGHSIDLSAGGLRFVTSTLLDSGQRLFTSFNTPDGGSYRGLSAKVVRTQTSGERHTVALRFAAISDELENQLVHTVFRLQIKGHAKR